MVDEVKYYPSSTIARVVTLSDDNPHPISDIDIPFYCMDIQCQTNDIYIGVAGTLNFKLATDETYWTYNGNLRDFMIKNQTAGQNGVAVIIATVPNKFVEKALGIKFGRVG
jgi:hypothetical protein